MSTDREDPTRPAVRGPRRHERAFTLIEMMIAATLGALLLTATASMAGMFGTQLGNLNETQDVSLEESLSALTDEVRYAWWAEVPNATTLTLSDPQGNTTTYSFRVDKLVVVRPDGRQGYLLQGLRGGHFSAETVTRYREGSARARSGTLWSRTLPPGTLPTAKILENNDKLAIGFTLPSTTPLASSLVPGIAEQLLAATPTSISLPLAAITPFGATLRATLYRARAPNDARPEGASLGSFVLDPVALPAATSWIWNTFRLLKVTPPLGALWGWWKLLPNLTLAADAPASTVALDLSALGATLAPGRAYTLQLAMSGSGAVVVGTAATGSASNSGVAFDAGGAGMAEAALSVPCRIDGNVSVTAALANTVVDRVGITLIGADGTQVSGSVTLTGQGMADDAWLGIVPGETDP